MSKTEVLVCLVVVLALFNLLWIVLAVAFWKVAFEIQCKIERFYSNATKCQTKEQLYTELIRCLTELFNGVHTCALNILHGEMCVFYVDKEGHCSMSDDVRICRQIQDIAEENRADYVICRMQISDREHLFVCQKKMKKHNRCSLQEQILRSLSDYVQLCARSLDDYSVMYKRAVTDELTGVYNRHHMVEYVEKNWDPNKTASCMYLDIDNFRMYNELYGKRMGDSVLQWVACVMSEVNRGMGRVFRMGANEFLIFTQEKTRDQVLGLAEEIKKAVGDMNASERPAVLQEIQLSIGISFYPDTAKNQKDLLRQSEKTVFFIKKTGKNQIRIYEQNQEREEDNGQAMAEWYEQVAPTVYALTATIDVKDSYTFQHSNHVSEYAILLGRKLGLNNNDIQILKEAGLLHDIGKIGIPEEILQKKGKLTTEEYECMKRHVQNSTEIIQFLPNMNYVIPAVLSHHERYDGQGYPRGLKGEEIPLLGRILSICDSFDAMTTKRVYNSAKSLEEAREELLRYRGTQFDPTLVDVFVELIDEGKLQLLS